MSTKSVTSEAPTTATTFATTIITESTETMTTSTFSVSTLSSTSATESSTPSVPSCRRCCCYCCCGVYRFEVGCSRSPYLRPICPFDICHRHRRFLHGRSFSSDFHFGERLLPPKPHGSCVFHLFHSTDDKSPLMPLRVGERSLKQWTGDVPSLTMRKTAIASLSLDSSSPGTVRFNVSALMNIPWTNELTNPISVASTVRKQQFCDLINILTRETKQPSLFNASCEVTTFYKPEDETRNTMVSADVDLTTVSGTRITAKDLEELLKRTFARITSQNSLLIVGNSIAVQKMSQASCKSAGHLCSEHARCEETGDGITCECNTLWTDKNPMHPGTTCELHPGIIGLLVIGAVLCLGAVSVATFAVLLRKKRYDRVANV
ncbi:hypothetical protein FBUS_10780 [Fasciolopsis buskii]|uniref:EGF-like domain-containing protein n=1 Tax=Fasciolopsis buskii TaxID=27845 RepID=A0A8E0VEE4_9TREM|nr:hypothetical protein FBUS_10780 [Fasciolopsis buski]